jgi:hypothetical protein
MGKSGTYLKLLNRAARELAYTAMASYNNVAAAARADFKFNNLAQNLAN